MQVTALPGLQVLDWHVSPTVHALPSVHEVPFGKPLQPLPPADINLRLSM
jgi:hypothetical protein